MRMGGAAAGAGALSAQPSLAVSVDSATSITAADDAGPADGTNGSRGRGTTRTSRAGVADRAFREHASLSRFFERFRYLKPIARVVVSPLLIVTVVDCFIPCSGFSSVQRVRARRKRDLVAGRGRTEHASALGDLRPRVDVDREEARVLVLGGRRRRRRRRMRRRHRLRRRRGRRIADALHGPAVAAVPVAPVAGGGGVAGSVTGGVGVPSATLSVGAALRGRRRRSASLRR